MWCRLGGICRLGQEESSRSSALPAVAGEIGAGICAAYDDDHIGGPHRVIREWLRNSADKSRPSSVLVAVTVELICRLKLS